MPAPLLPLFVTDPTARIAFIAAVLVWSVPEMIGSFWQRARVSRQAARVQDRGSMALLLGLQWTGLILSFALAWSFPAAAISGPRLALFALGLVCILLGVALRGYAIYTLGRYFTRDVAVSADQPVVQRGPYRLVRHPAYSGTFLTMLGLGLALTNWASLVVLLAGVFLGHFYRVRVEEKALVQAIGQPYIDYMQRTRRFIPWLF